MDKMYWVYDKNRLVSYKEMDEIWEQGNKEYGGRIEWKLMVAVYKMMPKAKRPQFEYEAVYNGKGLKAVRD